MSTITQRRKLSKGTWALIILLFVAVIAIGVCAFLGYISLQFMADWLVSVGVFGAQSWVNQLIVISASAIGFGVIPTIFVYRYFKGQSVTAPAGTYTPMGQTLSQPSSKDTETVIS